MPDRSKELLETWWSQVDKEKKAQAQAGYYKVKADRQTADLVLEGMLAPTLKPGEKQDLQRDGTLPKDIQTYIMRHD